MKTLFPILLLFFFSFNIIAQEDVIYDVIPGDYTNTPGNSSFTSEFATTARTMQLLIHESLLTDILNQQILGVSWRLPAAASSNWPLSEEIISDYEFYLGPSVDPVNMSLTDFASNFSGSKMQVRDGSMTIPANSYTFGNTPNDWGPEMTFILDSIYVYTGGHLLIELHQSGASSSRSVDALSTSTTGYGTLFRACWGSGFTANSGNQANFSIVRISADIPVPVELTSFSSTVSGNNVTLQWGTATETNNLGFEVQRKSGDSDFEVLGFISGAGTTTEPRNYFFTDSKLPNSQYIYRLKQIDFDGAFSFSDEIIVEVEALAEYSLEQNYPNPFNPSTNINFSLAEAGVVKMAVYNLLGQQVEVILDEFREAGLHSITFNASNLPSGAYFYTIETPQFKQTRKMLLTK